VIDGPGPAGSTARGFACAVEGVGAQGSGLAEWDPSTEEIFKLLGRSCWTEDSPMRSPVRPVCEPVGLAIVYEGCWLRGGCTLDSAITKGLHACGTSSLQSGQMIPC